MNVEFFENVVYKNVNNRLKESFIKKNYPQFYELIINNFSGDSFLEKLFIFYKGKTSCIKCGKNTKFISFKKGHLKYCSYECSSNSIEVREKYKKTCLEKYGHTNPSKSEKIKEKKELIFKEKYGVKCYFQTEDVKNIIKEKYGVDNVFKSPDIQDKIKNKNLEKYGVEYVLKSNEVRKTFREKMIKKYGVDSYSKTENFKKIMSNFNLEKVMNDIKLDGYEILSKSSYVNVLRHKKCNSVFEIQTQLIRKRFNSSNEICMICNPQSPSIKEKELFDYIKSIGFDPIKYRDKKYEIDIFLEDINIGFEFNGLYWHSELFKDKNYHYDKYHYFKEKGIQVIFIYEDDWKYKNNIVKSIIRNKLQKTEEIIYARNCQILDINNKISKKFLNENHIQGWCVSKLRYGLYHNGNLVSILTIGKNRLNLGQKSIENNYEILRFCNALNISVVGGFSKMLKYFIKQNIVHKITTYADCSTSNGNLYQKSGFNFIGFTKPNYFYFSKKENKKINRFNFTKQKLIKEGFDKTQTEKEIMFNRDYYRIYDSGSIKYELNFT